ncbi:ATP-binding protein [Cucumibacter marinus]|uniref:ATP-binding protein n=1 Tax=Cucumibacter marinus TaxID=1121252 RepID=UPI00040CB7B6|nr:ATP-binding protein [Cucumibacter marinus]
MARLSIAARLFWLSSIGLVIALVATGLLLSELYSRALERTVNDTLDFQLTTLVARVLEAEDLSDPVIAATDPRFDRPASGWYWQIEAVDSGDIAVSNSTIGSALPRLDIPFDENNARAANARDANDIWIRIRERKISLPEIGDVIISVTSNWDEVAGDVAAFRQQTLLVLVLVGLLLAGLLAVVARTGLHPLRRLRTAVESVRAGETPSVAGEYPVEIAPLAEEVNELLRSNAQIVERARSQVGNLAHGLKTPIAVLRNDAREGRSEIERSVLNQTDRMSGLVATYLDRAQLSARSAIVGQRADVGQILDRLCNVMSKLHRDRDVALTLPPDADIWFRGDAGDLEEMTGNLVDNACKWARSSVMVSASLAGKAKDRVLIEIEDDGAGLTEEECEAVLKRGVRLDEKTPGSGLGLDIVKELVDIYGGSLQLGRAQLGGLSIRLDLPAARMSRG